MSEALRIGVVGVGAIGSVHAHNIATRVPVARLAAVVDVNPDRRRGAGSELGAQTYASLADMLSGAEVDAVVISTPRDTHATLIAEAAAAGKHIFCEKPLAAGLRECDDAIASASAAGVALQVGFNRRFDPAFQRAAEAVSSGRLGEPRLLHIISRDPPPASGDPSRSPADLLFETTIHDFDTVRYLTRSEATEVYAAGLPAPESGRLEGVVVLVRLASGALVTIDNHLAAAVYDQRVEVFGAAGAVFVENEELPARVTTAPFFAERYDSAYVAEMDEFADSINKRRDPPVTARDGRAAVLLAEAAMRSLETGKPVPITEGSAE